MAVTDYKNQYEAFMKFKEEDNLSKYTEIASLRTLIGSVDDLTILDLGCGFGHHARWMAKSGAKKVIGVDLSDDQIRVARELNANRQSMEFVVGNAEKLLSLPLTELDFDLVVSMFMMTHLKSIATLEKVLKNVYQVLRSDSRLIGVYPNAVSKPEIAKKYNFFTDFNPKKHWPGSRYTNRVDLSDGGSFECSEMYITPDIFRRCAQNAGFLDVQFYKPTISEEGKKAKSEAFWKEFLEIPLYQFFVCRKF